MPLRLNGMVVDCADPGTLARFWADALGGTARELHGGELAVVRAGSEGAMPIVFHVCPREGRARIACTSTWRSSPTPSSVRRCTTSAEKQKYAGS